MPEKDLAIWGFAVGVLSSFLIFIGLKARERKVINDEFDSLHERVNSNVKDLSDHKLEISKKYPTTTRIEKMMDDGFKRHTAEMKIVIRDEIDRVKKE